MSAGGAWVAHPHAVYDLVTTTPRIDRPAYLSVYADVARHAQRATAIVQTDGGPVVLAAGETLTSARAIADRIGAPRSTVRRAFAFYESHGIFAARPAISRGPQAAHLAAHLAAHPPTIVNVCSLSAYYEQRDASGPPSGPRHEQEAALSYKYTPSFQEGKKKKALTQEPEPSPEASTLLDALKSRGIKVTAGQRRVVAKWPEKYGGADSIIKAVDARLEQINLASHPVQYLGGILRKGGAHELTERSAPTGRKFVAFGGI